MNPLISLFAQLPDSGPTAPTDGLQSDAGWFIGVAKWLGLTVCIIAVVVAAARAALAYGRHEGVEGFGGVGKALGAVAVISGSVALVSAVAG